MKNILHLPERVILKTKDKDRNLNFFAAINPKSVILNKKIYCPEPKTVIPYQKSVILNLFQGLSRRKTKIVSKAGFSLVEMLMALLVASLLMAALAPVMTRKMHENLVITGTGGAVIPTSSCDYTTPGTFGQNGECTVPSNIYEAGFIIASGGGGGGASADMISTSVAKVDSVDAATSSSGSQTSKTYEFTNDTKTLRFLISGGGGGAGGAHYSSTKMGRPESQADCRDKDGNNFGQYVSSEQNGGNGAICVALYHPGESRVGSPDIPGTVTKCTAGATSGQTGYCGDKQECITDGNCCWQGATTNSGACDANGYSVSGVFSNTYGGCNRSSCQYSAADKICSNWKPLGNNGGTGRLPTKSEISAWASNIKYTANPPRTGVLNRNTGYDHPGLQLCEYWESSKYGATRCWYASGRCAGSGTSPGLYVNYCHVMVFWLSDKADAGEGYHWIGSLQDGILKIITNGYKTTAYSARCVIDQVYTFESYAGGGGSAGAYLSVDIPSEVLEKATENGGKAKAVLKAGAGGNAGTTVSGSSTGGRGINGMPSSVEIYSDSSELIYLIEVSGGIGGYGANSTDAGSPADVLSADDKNCRYFNKVTGTGDEKNSPVNVKCSEITSSYNMGNVAPTKASGADTSSTGGKNTGWGASSLISSGGGGGFCTYEEKNLACPDVTNEGKGTGGRIDIYASTSHPGAGGGGGAAGSLVTFRSSKLIPGDKIVSTVGKGGNAGTDGEDSSVKIYRDDVLLYKLTVKGGGKGQNAIQAVISSNTPAKGGSGGVASGLNTAETSPATRQWVKNYKIYPENSEDTKGKDGISPQTWGVWNNKMAGGNGGVNSKISSEVAVDAGSSQGNPCGGLSVEAVKINNTTEWACENTSIAPFVLTRTMLEDFRYTFVDTPPGGSTGGGGGGWMYHTDGSPNVSNGAKGLDGYIYIYYGEWGKENTSQ